MRKTDQLFALIKSMSKAEKRYFKLYSTFQSGSKNYLELFSMLDKQVSYNEAKVRKRFEGEKFLSQLHVTKNYLYNLILKGLEMLHQGKTVKAQVPSLLSRIDILMDRELYTQALKLWKKTNKMALEQELLTDQLKLLVQKQHLDLQLEKGTALKEAQSLNEERIASVFSKLAGQFNLATSSDVQFDEFSTDTKEEIIRDSYHGKLQDFLTKISEYQELQQVALAYELAGKCLDFMIEHPEKLPGQIALYEKVNRARIRDGIKAGVGEKTMRGLLEDYLNIFQRFGIKGQELIRRRLENHYIHLLFMQINKSESPENFRDVVEAISDKWEEKRAEVLSTPKEEVANLLSSYYFKILEYHHCLVHVDRWVESYKKKIPAAAQAAIRCRYMMCGFEMDRWDLSTKRIDDLSDNQPLTASPYKSEVALSSFFKILNRVSNQTQKNNMFVLLKAELMGLLQNNPKEQKIFEHFDLLDWIDRRDNRRTFSQKLRDFSSDN